MRRPRLLIYAKPPRMGVAKTRLAKGMGPTAARRIAHMTLARTVRAAMGSGCEVVLYTAPDTALGESLGGIWPRHMERRSQGNGGLSARLNKGLTEAPNGPVMFVGADAPDITPGLLRQATRALMRNDAVFGPADDGGFWLFGMNKGPRTHSPFDDVRWSGPHAMADVAEKLQAGARVQHLQTLIDIDEIEDWRRWNHRANS